MKKMKWLGATGAVLALGSAGLLINPSPASAATITVTAGAGSSAHCLLNGGSAGLAPTLKDDWVQNTNDTTTPVQTFREALKSIPDQTFSSAGPTITTVKATVAPGGCTGTATDGTNSANITGAKLSGTITGTDPGPATCGGLATAALTGQTVDITIKWTTDTLSRKIADTHMPAADLGALLVHGTGFETTSSGAGITGSFGGGSSDGKTFIDQVSLTAFTSAVLGAKPNFGNNGATGSVCDPTLSIKSATATGLASDSISIKMKAPKGLKKISFVNSGVQTPAPDVATDSTLDISA